MSKKALLITLALVVLPFVIGHFQSHKFKDELKSQLVAEAQDVLKKNGVKEGYIILDRLDATIGGKVQGEEKREEIADAVSEVGGPGAVRATNIEKLKSYGDVVIKKVNDVITVDGKLVRGTWETVYGRALETKLGTYEFTQGSSYKEESYYVNPVLASQSPPNQPWLEQFFGIKGDRSVTVSAYTNEVYLYGKMTKKLEAKVLASAEEAGLIPVSKFEIVEPLKTKYTAQSIGKGQVTVNGVFPSDLDLTAWKLDESSKINKDEFVEAPKGLYGEGFAQWHQLFFDSEGRRGYIFDGDKVSFSGYATPFMLSDWETALNKMQLTPVSSLELFPSEYHYPGYKMQSKVSDEDLEKLQETFLANQVYFDTGVSEVIEAESFKVGMLATAIKQYGAQASYVIGGHADATGNIELNKQLSSKRAEAVLKGLKELGVDGTQFTIIPFGSAKAKSGGSSAADRRVEILVK